MTLACFAVHYGKEYLSWAVRGVQDVVDEVHVFYAPEPSFGHATPGARCPDNREEIEAAAYRFATKPIHWHVVKEHSEGAHRKVIHDVAARSGTDLYVVVDADEVWDPLVLAGALAAVRAENRAGRWLAGFANFWRSFQWMVDDAFRPIRIVDMRHPLTVDAVLSPEMQPSPVYHFGYAQSLATMRYKWSCHGHQAELRRGWLERFETWGPGVGDTHPVVNNLWTPRPTDAVTMAAVRRLLHDHPYVELPIIS